MFIVTCERINKTSKYLVSFSFNDQLIERIKNLPEEERKYSAIEKKWSLSVGGLMHLIEEYRKSSKIFFTFDDRGKFIELYRKYRIVELEKEKEIELLTQNKEKWVKYKNELSDTYMKYSCEMHLNLKNNVKLYPHQIIGALFMNEVKNTLLALDMGTGKSLCAIACAEKNSFNKVIVLTPNSLKFNYFNEIEKFTNSKSHVIGWKRNKYTIEESKYIIINYDFFNSSNQKYAIEKWNKLNIGKINALIADECQALKNTNSNRYKNYKKIFKAEAFVGGDKFSCFLSGTPMTNRAKELYSIMHEINSIDFKTQKYFYEYYCGMTYDYYNGYGWTVDESKTKFEELFNKISPYVYRKKIEEVIDDLPEKSYQKILLELDDSEQKTYDNIECGVVNEFTNGEINNPLTIMLRLRQYTSHNKVKYISELIDTIIDTGEKIVIFDVFKEPLKNLHEKYESISVLHTGDSSPEERCDMINAFQDGNSSVKIFLSTFSSGNFGLTLTAASKMFLLTLPYSLGEYIQAAARIFRIGQKNNVIIYPLIFSNTIDEYVYTMIESKQGEVSAVLDNEKFKSNTDESVLNDVIIYLKEKYGK